MILIKFITSFWKMRVEMAPGNKNNNFISRSHLAKYRRNSLLEILHLRIGDDDDAGAKDNSQNVLGSYGNKFR